MEAASFRKICRIRRKAFNVRQSPRVNLQIGYRPEELNGVGMLRILKNLPFASVLQHLSRINNIRTRILT